MSPRSTQNIHLLVLIHGMWGDPSNLASMHRIIEETHIKESSLGPDGATLHVMLPETNQAESTYDGIDWGGERVAEEIFQEIEALERDGKTVTRFSVTGYSLGGLVARYVVGILHQRKFFVTVTPVNFNTIATPHIGLLAYPSFFSRLSSLLGPKLLSRTGEQFYGVDKWSNTGKSLLEVMVDPGRVFFQGLKLFPYMRIYANAINDLTVPYMTAYLDLEDPFLNHDVDELTVDYDDKYFPVMKSFTVPDSPTRKRRKTPRPLSWQWFKTYKPPLPPRFQTPFPYNIVALALLPILFPTFIGLVIVRLSIASHHSRSRIKLLESEDTSNTQRLVHIFGQLEREVEDLVVDIVDDPMPITSQDQEKRIASKKTPRITPAQRKMVAVLNSLPQLKKERAYLPNLRNSHGVIIARDIKNFDFHKLGEGVLRHWADAFVM
ncbi:putative serine esterase-domain-containing protein [Russula dissimulans]|nr:putative serine esterase-domain-containing protein [Russula dissimulans]